MAEFAKVGPALASLRREAGLRQRDVADRLGIGASTIGRFESPRGNPRAKSIDRYLRAIGRTPRDLLGALESLADRGFRAGREAETRQAMLSTAVSTGDLARTLEMLREEFYKFRDDVTFRLTREASERTSRKKPTNGPKQRKAPNSSSD